jgi:hypothetical protein
MAFTRSQATGLLNQAEMGLFDDSRANALRGLDAGQLGKRVERARKARDRARDLLKRQKLASRGKTGSKRGASGDANQRSERKAELLGDVLARFEEQLKQVEKRDKQAAAKPARKAAATKGSKQSPAAKKSATKRASKKPAAGKKAATKNASTKKAATKKTSSKKTSSKDTSTKKPAGKQAEAGRSKPTSAAPQKRGADKPSASGPAAKAAKDKQPASKPITPKRALDNTRKLLEAKRARQRQGLPWQTLDPGHDHLPQAGYQSGQAAEQAEELHAGESRIPPIQGSISTRDRKNQGKRDRRGDSE